MAAPGNQGARMGIGKVVQLLDGLPDTLGQALTDRWRAVDGSGDCGDGDFCQGCDGTDVRILCGCLSWNFSSHVPILSHVKEV
jgi:hypothetical protein